SGGSCEYCWSTLASASARSASVTGCPSMVATTVAGSGCAGVAGAACSTGCSADGSAASCAVAAAASAATMETGSTSLLNAARRKEGNMEHSDQGFEAP